MYNFVYHVPTEVHFGEGMLNDLPEVVSRYGKKIMLIYGGEGIKKAPFWSRVLELLANAQIDYCEFGVEPNPKVNVINAGAALAKAENVDCLLAVGGGAAIDTAKLVAACVFYPGDAWDIISSKVEITAALPIVAVNTAAATGSDMDDDGVIGNPETNEKISIPNPLMRPAASILDPTLTYSVPPRQTALGAVDIMSHVMEQYFTNIKTAYLQDRFCEGILKTVIKYTPIALKEPTNYEARANLLWSASLALCGILGCGKAEPWSVHVIESLFCARYNTTHGAVIAILTPAWMKMALNEDTASKFAEYGVNVWGLAPDAPVMETAKAAISMTEEFFASIGAPLRFSQLNIGTDRFEEIAEAAAEPFLEEAYMPLNKARILELLYSCQ